eukprot:m.17555 g.17555  ORF g.17555 m.17555 type:complete len:869 (+) comp7496_c0_seq2:171-2777(+)
MANYYKGRRKGGKELPKAPASKISPRTGQTSQTQQPKPAKVQPTRVSVTPAAGHNFEVGHKYLYVQDGIETEVVIQEVSGDTAMVEYVAYKGTTDQLPLSQLRPLKPVRTVSVQPAPSATIAETSFDPLSSAQAVSNTPSPPASSVTPTQPFASQPTSPDPPSKAKMMWRAAVSTSKLQRRESRRSFADVVMATTFERKRRESTRLEATQRRIRASKGEFTAQDVALKPTTAEQAKVAVAAKTAANTKIKHGFLPLRDRVKAMEKLDNDIEDTKKLLTCWERTKLAVSRGWRAFTTALYSFFIATSFGRGTLRRIEGYVGNAIGSAFKFLSYMTMLNVVFAIFWAVIIVLPMGLESPYPTPEVRNSTNASQILREVLSGSGSAQDSWLFHGYYNGTFTNNGNFNQPVAFLSILIITYTCGLVFLLFNFEWLISKSSQLESDGETAPMGVMALTSWDFNINDEDAVKQQNIRYKIAGEEQLNEIRNEVKQNNFFGCFPQPEKHWVRVIFDIAASLLYLAMVGACSYFVREMNTIATFDADQDYFRTLLAPFIVTCAVWAMPIVYRVFASIITSANPEVRIWVNATNLLLGMLGFVASYLAEVTDQATQNDASLCWQTRLGQEIYRLFMMDFFFRAVVDILWTLVVVIFSWIAKTENPSINTEAMMLGLVYRQLLVWFGTPFVPFLPVLAVGVYIITFYIKRVLVLNAGRPPRVVIRLSQESYFRILLLSFGLASGGMLYLLFRSDAPYTCGPFMEIGHIADTISFMVNRAETSAGALKMYTVIFSRGFAVPILLALILLVIYQIYKRKAMALRMRELQGTLYKEQVEFKALLRRRNLITAKPYHKEGDGAKAQLRQEPLWQTTPRPKKE